MAMPSFANYVNLLLTLFDRFVQSQSARVHRGHPFVYQHQRLIVFFTLMQFRRIFHFKTQYRWLMRHLDYQQVLGLAPVPHRTTLSRRYKALYPSSKTLWLFSRSTPKTWTPPLAAASSTKIRVCSKPRDPSGTSQTARRAVSRPGCIISTPMLPGAKARIMAGSMAMVCI